MVFIEKEKVMFEVMQSLYDSGIPISFKGSMVLKACLAEAGYLDDVRQTVDIDANWNSDLQPTTGQIAESFQSVLNKIGIEVGVYRMYGEGRSAGLTFTDRNSGNSLFTMDIDVNRPTPATKMYEVDGFHFCGVTPSQMIADKISVVSTDKVFRRVKDVIDLYYFSKVFDFDGNEIFRVLENSGRLLGNFHGFLHRVEDLRHAYEKFNFVGGVYKPPFNDVYHSVKSYIKVILPKERHRDLER